MHHSIFDNQLSPTINETRQYGEFTTQLVMESRRLTQTDTLIRYNDSLVRSIIQEQRDLERSPCSCTGGERLWGYTDGAGEYRLPEESEIYAWWAEPTLSTSLCKDIWRRFRGYSCAGDAAVSPRTPPSLVLIGRSDFCPLEASDTFTQLVDTRM